MGIKIETWSIAFRNKSGDGICDSSIYHVLNNGHQGWYADPFLFKKDGKLYLFAEFFSYRLGRGVISFAEYSKSTNSFGQFKVCLIEDYHLSYPFIFEYQGDIYMLPECNKSNSLILYKAVDFPYQWEKTSIMMDHIRLVDTTPFIVDSKLYAITMRLDDENSLKDKTMLLLRINPLTWKVDGYSEISNDISVARPGGHVYSKDGCLFAVTQDCKDEYGKALNILKICDLKDMKMRLDLIKKIYPDDICVDSHIDVSGIHTYNCCDEIEVIDIKVYRKSYYRILMKALRLMKIIGG